MASLFNTRISDTYPGLIKSIDNAALTASLKELTDGSGNATGVFMNNAGDFKVTAILEFGSLKDTGENITISKFVDAADGIGNNDNDTTIPTTAAIIDYVAAQITIEDLDFTGDTGSGQIDLDSQIFAIGGTTNEITTVASGQSITFSLDSTGVNLPDNSTAITQTAGDNSTKIATTSYVDTLDAASDLDFSGDSGTGDVNLNTQTFAITGTTNQITTSASGQGLSLSLPATVHRNLQGNVTGNVTGDLTGNVTSTSVLADGVTATTQASSDDSTKVATTAYVKGLNNASDLDFTTDSGSGAVVLNSQTFSVLGTTNEIETSGSGQAITIGLPSTVNVNVTGNLTGNVIGNVTGNITGDVTGDVTGNLTGNSTGTHTGGVIGNVTGDVTGDLTGNADTATKWQTARDLSLTGQATGTISSVDGSGNVSGAVTLDNNSVTSKVLTGLPTPSSSSVLATDTILEGFGKLQSQLNGIANGLQFQGSWDADTNSPVLSSGGGEATNGTTTATTANKLVDSSASFTSTVTVGDKVVNQVDGQSALVTNIDSDTTLSIDADIMLNNEAYTIDNSPFITQGHYYVVSVGGTTILNGVSNWAIGDWVIAGANNQWTKLDHSQVDGTGTPGNLTKWSATQVIADSIVSESGTAITVDGSLSTNTNLSSTGDFAVNTDKFTVAAASGNTAFAGDLAINTNKFTVNATSGNTVVGGDVTLSSGYLNVTTDGSVAYGLLINSGDQSHSRIRINNTGSGGNAWSIMSGTSGVSNDGFAIRNETTTTTALQFTNTGNATFAGSVGVGGNAASNGYMVDITPTGGNIIRSTRGTSVFGSYQSNNSDVYLGTISNNTFKIITNDTTAITVSNSQNSTFAGYVKAPFFTTDGGRGFKQDGVVFGGTYSNGADANGANDLGSTTNQWRDIYLSGDITSSSGGATFAGDVNVGTRQGLKASNWGYSSSYKTLILGSSGTNYQTDAVTLAFGVDNSGNSSASFTGNGRELLFRNDAIFKTPNSANNAYFEPLGFNEGRVGVNNIDPTVRLEVGKNDSEVEALSVRYSTVPAYISSSFDGSYALSTFSTNQYNTSDGSAGWGSMSNASYGTASVQLAANTQGGELRFFTAPGANQDPTERMRIDSSGNTTFTGNVGVAGKTPAYGLNLAQGTGAGNKIAWTDVTPHFAASIYASSSTDKLTFATKNASNVETTALEIDTLQNATFAGNVNIIASNSSTGSSVSPKMLIYNEGAGDSALQLAVSGSLSYYLGVDNSDNTFKIGNASWDSSPFMAIDSSGNTTFAGDVIQSGTSKSLKYFRRLWTDANNDWGLNNNAGTSVISVSGMGTPSTSTTTFAGNLTANVGSFNSPDASESILMNLVANNGNNAATFRTTASGHIFEIRSQNSGTIKIDSSTTTFTGDIIVPNGKISTTGGNNLTISGSVADHAGLIFATNSVLPAVVSAETNNIVDLGQNGNGYKDLYLGGGIFLGGTGTANKLDDYEEGTFTPVLKFNGATTGITYSTQAGVYTKVGRQVNFSVEIRLSNKGSATGTCTIDDLPFTSGNITGNYGSCMISYATSFTVETGTHFTIDPNTTNIKLRFMNGTFSNNYGSGQFDNSTVLLLTGSYQSA